VIPRVHTSDLSSGHLAYADPSLNRQARDSRLRLLAMVACAVAAVALGLLGEWAFSRTGAAVADLIRDLAVGWAYVAVGLVTWWRRPDSRIGWIMVAEGLGWFLGNLQGLNSALLVAMGFWLEGLNLAILGHLVLALPEGRLDSRWRKLVVIAGYALVAIVGLIRTIAYSPGAQPGTSYLSCDSCTENLLFVPTAGPWFPALDNVYQGAGVVLGVVVAGMLIARWIRTPRPNRHLAMTAWSLIALLTLAVSISPIPAAADGRDPLVEQLPWLTDLVQVGVPLSFLLIPLHRQLATAAVTRLVVEVGQGPAPTRLRDALARALRDPRLELGFWIPEQRCYVGSEGLPLQLPDSDSGRAVTYLERNGTPLAVMVHDRALVHERNLMNGARAVIQLGLENERLQAQVRAQLEDVRASRVRIVVAADAARRQLERDLHDGAQQRLVSVLMHLRAAQQDDASRTGSTLDEVDLATDELRAALSELRELANGIHPAVLTQRGLAAAVTVLAQRSALPVEVAIPDERHPPLVEATAYFIISEALTNAAKHSRAAMVRVAAGRLRDRLIVEVVDDGAGGADPLRGSGLSGLGDRAAVLGGHVSTDSLPGRGTRVRAELPCV
jgi:signal transduction histidine kinase